MGLGSDIRPLKEAALLEMGLWVRDGATPWQALQAATKNAAQLCGVGDDLGTLEAGKLADMIVVSANPLDDITTSASWSSSSKRATPFPTSEAGSRPARGPCPAAFTSLLAAAQGQYVSQPLA